MRWYITPQCEEDEDEDGRFLAGQEESLPLAPDAAAVGCHGSGGGDPAEHHSQWLLQRADAEAPFTVLATQDQDAPDPASHARHVSPDRGQLHASQDPHQLPEQLRPVVAADGCPDEYTAAGALGDFEVDVHLIGLSWD